MTNKTTTLLLALCALLVIAGVAVSELVCSWNGIFMILGGSCLAMWTQGKRCATVADEKLERMKQKLQEYDEMYARMQDRERGDDV